MTTPLIQCGQSCFDLRRFPQLRQALCVLPAGHSGDHALQPLPPGMPDDTR